MTRNDTRTVPVHTTPYSCRCCRCPDSRDTPSVCLLLGVGQRHAVRGVDAEALQAAERHGGLGLAVEFHEGDAGLGLHHAHLLEARELLEQHGQHLRRGGLRQALHEQDLVGRRRGVRADGHGRRPALLLLLRPCRLALPLLPLAVRLALLAHAGVPRREAAVQLGHGVALRHRIRQSHGFVVEGEAVHGAHGGGGGGDVGEHHPRLAAHLVRFGRHHIQDLAELAEHRLQRLLQLILLDLLVEVVDVDGLARGDVAHRA
mmetsp:Transcript_29836/g.73975  ORF Transcript_29836/g.73975 Transcript_29836/m.73975 type:complete len:260 (-) Transcript_29836:6-785(-)